MKRLDTIIGLEEERVNDRLLSMNSDVAIRFSDVKFAYSSENAPVFERLNLQVAKGQCVGIVGDSGAGKSTLVQLLSGLYEIDAGKIELFGQDIQDLDLENLRSHISYVSQQTYIMPGAIYENIRFGKLDASEDDVIKAAERAGLKEYIDTLSNGLHATLSEGGDNLSGGQRQRISLARAFIRNSPIYIFDEPTSALDPGTESRIVQQINEIVKQGGVTSIIISHNARTIENCDKVYYLREGKIYD